MSMLMKDAPGSPAREFTTIELPGISPENKERTLHLWEREYGKFERSFRFPLPVHEAKVMAEFVNGILTVKVPKMEVSTPTPRTVPIAKK